MEGDSAVSIRCLGVETSEWGQPRLIALQANGTRDYDGAYWLVNAFAVRGFARCAMVCAACGTPVVDGVKFCARCGAAVAAAPFQGYEQPVYAAQPSPVAGHYGLPYVARLRVARNLQTLGILWYVFAAYRALAGLIGFFALHFFAGGNFGPGWPFNHSYMGHGPAWMAALGPVIAVYTVMAVALAVFTGYSLLNRKPWGRTVAIIAAVLALLKFPFGTAIGIFTLWVMAPAESGMEWESMADRN